MELSNALSRRLSDLQEWQQEAVLTIRKAFTFDDIDLDLVELTPVLDTGFVPVARDDGYGFCREDSWILAYPDAKTRQIVVSKRIDGRTYKTRINTFKTIYKTNPNPVGDLQCEIVDFLALAMLKANPIDW